MKTSKNIEINPGANKGFSDRMEVKRRWTRKRFKSLQSQKMVMVTKIDRNVVYW